MALKSFKPVTAAQRGLVLVDNSELYKGKPFKKLTKGLTKSGGRNNYGHLTARRKGGGHKRKYRIIDFKRNILIFLQLLKELNMILIDLHTLLLLNIKMETIHILYVLKNLKRVIK